MKRLFTLLIAVVLTLSVFAQTPQKMSYQAVIRDSDSKLVTTQVGMRISILQGSGSGSAVYVETQTPTPNINGLVTIEIGTGTTTDDFSAINWAAGPYFIKTETAVAPPLTTYTIEGTSQILSVPYALLAKKVESESDPVYTAWDKDYSDLTNKPSLATVATSGSYDDLSDKPSIPTQYTDAMADLRVVDGITGKVDKVTGKGLSTEDYSTAEKTKLTGIATGAEENVNADWNATTGDAQILNKPSLATVATSGSYADLTGTPTLATVATSGSYADLTATPSLANVATSGSYNDLGNKPSIPTQYTDAMADLRVVAGITDKVDKVTGKGLSTNDYTTEEQTKLAAISGTNTGDNAVNSLYSGLVNYTHPTGDGNLHVPATSTTNSGKVLTAGATAGSLSWSALTSSQWTTTGSDIYYNSGNVGIGTTTPTSNLTLNGATNSFIELQSAESTKGYFWWANPEGYLAVGPGGGGNSIIFKNDNVGIGTTAPLSKISAVNNNFDATTNPGYKFYGHQSSSSATVPLFHIQTGWENNVTANVFKVNTYQNEAGFNILSNGNVGIGTTTPSSLLTVNNGAIEIQSSGVSKGYVWYDLADDYLAIGRGAVSNSIFITNGNVGIGTTTPAGLLQVGHLMFGGDAGREIYSTNGYDINYKATGVSAHHFYTNGTEKFTIDKTGNVGIGTTTPASNLTVNGTADAQIQLQSAGTTKGYFWWDSGNLRLGVGPGASNNSFIFNPSTSSVNFLNASCNGTTWIDASDSRLKRDIQPMSKYGLSTVMQLKPVTYFYKADKTNHPEVGFIAQEVQKIVPEVVSGKEGDITKGETLGLSYGNLVPVLTKAIQEQQATIEAQQKQIDELKKMVEGLKAQVSK